MIDPIESRPGYRRFHDLLDRERHDMAWLVHTVAAMYDEISGGRVSKPMTYPSEVVAAFEDRLDAHVEEAITSYRLGLTDAVKELPAQEYSMTGLDRTTDSRMINREAVLRLIGEIAP